jgi:spermidine/putrescine transport system substrate-binding protein
MRQMLLAALTAAVALSAGCSKSPTGTTAPASQPAEPGKQVNLFIWSEYIDPDLLPEFQKRTGMSVRMDVYEATEDMIAKLQQAGGAEQYDVVVASDHAIPVLAKLGLIQPLDLARIPNAKNVAPRFQKPTYDPEGRYSLPYQWGTLGLVYRKDKVPALEASWSVLFQADKQPGPFILIDSMRDMMGAALKYHGKSLNTTIPGELKAAGEMLIAAKKSSKFVGFEGGVGGKNRVASGDAVVAMSYNGDALEAMAEDPNLAFVTPKEGTVIWVDAMTITARTRNLEGACKFIDFILDAKIGAQLSNFKRYASPNAASLPLIRPEDRQNREIYPDDAMIKTMEYIQDVQNATRLYDEVWTAVKSR